MTRPYRSIGLALVAILLLVGLSGPASADRVKLKDGTTVEGAVISRGDGYWVKLADGTSRTIPKGDVRSIDKGSPPAAPAAPTPPAPAGKAAAGAPHAGIPATAGP